MFGNIHICSVCMSRVTVDQLQGLSCGHMFCAECWDHYCQVQIQQGITTGRWRIQEAHFENIPMQYTEIF